jgi:hypothetical protein
MIRAGTKSELNFEVSAWAGVCPSQRKAGGEDELSEHSRSLPSPCWTVPVASAAWRATAAVPGLASRSFIRSTGCATMTSASSPRWRIMGTSGPSRLGSRLSAASRCLCRRYRGPERVDGCCQREQVTMPAKRSYSAPIQLSLAYWGFGVQQGRGVQ